MKKVQIKHGKQYVIHVESPIENFVTLCGEIYNRYDPSLTRMGDQISAPVLGKHNQVTCNDCLAVVAYCRTHDLEH